MTENAAAASTTPQQQLAAAKQRLAAHQKQINVLLTRTDDRKRLAQAANAALGHMAQGTEACCQAAIADIKAAATLRAKYRGDHRYSNATAVAGALDQAAADLAAIAWKPPAPPAPPAKATVSWDEQIGHVVRDPAREAVRQVKVKRSGSTKAPTTAPVPVTVTGLPDGVLVAAEPASFKAGQARSYVALRFTPSPPPALRAGAVAPLTGKADLGATDELVPGPGASQAFTVSDQPEPPPPAPSANPFHLPGVDLGPLPFLLGMSMGFRASQLSLWLSAIGRPPLCCSGGSHAGGRTTTWRGVRGGDKGAIAPGTQLDIIGKNLNLSDAFEIIGPGTGLIVACWNTVPDGTKPGDYTDLANGAHDNDAYIFGWNAWLLMKSGGYSGAQLVLRGDKEYDVQTYGVTEANAPQRAKWLARFILNFNRGYLDAGADAPARHVLGLARHPQMGPLEFHIPIGPGGAVMIDAVDVSMHPPMQGLGTLVGRPFDVKVAGVEAWIAGDFDGQPCYAPNHKDKRYSALAVAEDHGILISNFESSPRDDGALACPISDAAWQGLFNFWTENAALLAGVGVYNDTCLDRTLNVPGWSAGVDKFVALARGGR